MPEKLEVCALNDLLVIYFPRFINKSLSVFESSALCS